MAAEKGKGGNFSFKGFTMCFKPSENIHKKKEEKKDDTQVKVKLPDPKLPDPVTKLKVADTGKKFTQQGRIETNMSSTVKYTWFIWNFSTLNCQYIYSETFFTGNHPWRILLYPNGGTRKGYLSIYLSTGDDSVLSADSWSKLANFKLTLYNRYFKSKTLETKYEFGSGTFPSFGYASFITLTEFHGPNNGYLVDDSCTIIAEVTVENSGHQHSNDNRLMPSELTLNNNNNNNLVDFKGLCKVRRDLVPLLDEACSKHPKLVESQKGKKLSEKSFTALGRVLYFLTSYKNVKDMNDDAVKELKSLWEELESSGFEDLTWLKNDVNFALGIKEESEEEEEKEKGEEEAGGELLKVE